MKQGNVSSHHSRIISELSQNVVSHKNITSTASPASDETEALMNLEHAELHDSTQALALADLKRILASRLLLRWSRQQEATRSTRNIA